ncbi:hypothetical protein GGI03_002561, partial [Coemansia sp. RSA 2337]
MVRSISFLFSLPSATEQQTFIATTSPDAESNISAFVKRVKQIATKLEKIGIIISPHDNGPPSPVQQLNDLVQQLCQQAVDIEYEVSRQPVILDQRLNGLRNLVYVSFDSTDGGEQIVQLVRRNASTLQSLDVLESTLTNVNGLILNDDGGYMQYPCLHTLKFSGRRGPDVPRLLVFPGAVPFPNLRKLSIGLKCLFGDDTLFRGNAATLETLSLSPSPTSARVIREYRVFTPVSHPKLQYVRFGVSSDSEPNLFDTDVEYLRFVLSIGPNAHVRAIYDRFVGLEFQSLIPAFGEHTCIQVLALEANDIIECGGQHFTKHAYLRISYSAVLTGVLARLLASEPYCQAVFPQVESIQLNLAKGGALSGLDDVECRQNVSKFVGRIKSMFPNAEMCSISNTMFCLPEEDNATKHYSQLVTELAQNARRIKYYTSNEMFSIGTLVNLSNLTHLVYSECNSTNAFIQLVLNNASTLQVLNLDLDNPELFTQFVHTDTGMQVAYPCLHTLKSICTSDNIIERRCSPLHTPFPNLTHLTMTHSYPFTNDALFRGNSTYMQHLAMHLDVIDLLILDRSGVFEKNKFSKLSVLDLDINLIDQPFNLEFGQRICRIPLKIATGIE